MDSNLRYEIRAEAFRLMTGQIAPGKSASPATYPDPIETRFEKWKAWSEKYGECIQAMLLAVDHITEEMDGSVFH